VATISDFRTMAAQVRNWNRWGADDQLGTLNHITEKKVREAAGLVRRGAIFPLGLNFESNGPQPPGAFRRNPLHLMFVDGGDASTFMEHVAGSPDPAARNLTALYDSGPVRVNDDYVIMPLQCATQWDALSHVYCDDMMYNGVPASAVTSFGATRLGIEQMDKRGVISRGVLLDVPRARGEDRLADGSVIEPEELEEVAARQGVSVGSGDVVLIRTGAVEAFLDGGRVGTAGLSWRCAAWLHERDVAAVAADNVAVESLKFGDGHIALPMHLLCLREMGMMLGELWNMAALAADCTSDGIYEFQLCAPPLRVTGGVGSPLNPLAVK
jgi:kynurenine formamidase